MKFFLFQIQQHSSEMPNAAGTEKYYVVVGVIAILFLGIVGYLVSMDKKIKELEKWRKAAS